MLKLTSKQQLFVEEFLVDLNATQAAIRAGSAKRSAQQTSSRPLEDLPDAARRLIASVEFEPGQGRKVRKLKLLNRLKVLELIGKHVNVSAFRENLSHSVNDDLMERMERARSRVAQR